MWHNLQRTPARIHLDHGHTFANNLFAGGTDSRPREAVRAAPASAGRLSVGDSPSDGSGVGG